MNPILIDHLRPVLARLLLRRFWLAAATGWLALSLLFLAVLVALRDSASPLPWNRPGLAIGCVLVLLGGAATGLLATWPRRRDFPWAARQLEKKFTDLNACLITAVEQRPRSDGSYGYLQQEVIRRAVYHSFQHGWQQLVPLWQLTAAIGLGGAGLFAVFGLSLAWLRWIPPRPATSHWVPFEQLAVDESAREFSVEPGDTEIEKGTSLLVFARFPGPLPPRAYLNFTLADGQTGRLNMFRSLSDPVYAARLNDVQQPLDYSVDLESQVSPTFHVQVFEYPALVRADALLKFPMFTGLPDKQVEDVRRITAVEGTELTWTFELNKPVAQAQLVDESGEMLELQPTAEDAQRWTTALTLETSRRFELRLADERGRANRNPPRFFLNVLPHQAPHLTVKRPGRDLDASPLEEVPLAAEVWNEFGAQGAGLTYWPAGGEPRELRLAEAWTGPQKNTVQQLLPLEPLSLVPDQMVAYYFWVDDATAEGVSRRTTSDLFFIEIRPFDEIFRQGQQPTEEQLRQQSEPTEASPSAQAAEDLAELQKQIITATWNLMRRESAAEVSPSYAEDLRLLDTSQQSVLEQLSGLVAQLRDPQSTEVARVVAAEMTRVIEILNSPTVTIRAAALQPALDAEQAAYQGLLRLRSREHEMVRRRQRNASGQTSGSSRQNQMQEMELQEDDNRYEQERLAAEGETPEARENRQVLNRLRELARRQADLNERIKELQNALSQAADEQQRSEIERRLQRLRDEQQEVLRDTDELQERMQTAPNREQMAEPSQQLDEARETIRQSASALDSNQISRAAAEGERAREQLDALRDEFQRRAANQFTEQVQQLQNQAEALQENQERVGQQLSELDHPTSEPQSLRSLDRRSELSNALRQQAERLANLQESVKETIDQAEEIEPLLAESLYDTYRQTEQQQTQTRLQSAAESLERGFDPDAQAQELQARESIEALRAGIDQAAESVLGDQQAALRRASETLEQLADELRQELAQELEPNESNRDSRANLDGPPRPGERTDGERTDGERTDGERTDGERTDSERNRQRPGLRGQSDRDPQQRDGELSTEGQPNLRMQREDRPAQPIRPMSGGDFRSWSDRLRDVEEMLNDDDLRNEASRIRDSARTLRREMQQRHSPEPQWDLVQLRVMTPLDRLQRRVQDELIRKSNRRSVVPLDRDPVPIQYQDAVRKYYEQLGTGQ